MRLFLVQAGLGLALLACLSLPVRADAGDEFDDFNPPPTGGALPPSPGAPVPQPMPGPVGAPGPYMNNGPYWAPGGDMVNGMRVGSPYYWSAPSGAGYFNGGMGNGGYPGGVNPYNYHFGPGFHRNQDMGHYRFPYYSYRRPWYHPGYPSYNRDTNYPW